MSTMQEISAEYRMAAVKIKMKIKQLEADGAPPQEINKYRIILQQLRDSSQLLSGYYDTPRVSENAAIGWSAGKKVHYDDK